MTPGFLPMRATALRMAARSTRSGTPVKSCKTMHAATNGISSVAGDLAFQLTRVSIYILKTFLTEQFRGEDSAMIARGYLIVVVAALLAVPAVRGDGTYDWLAGTQWYVPEANLLAYRAPVTDLSSTLPISDQTLWNITSSVNGQFSGTTQA